MTKIEEYIASCPKEFQDRLSSIYHILKEELPDAIEKISYQIPTFWQGENVIHFSLFKNHIGLYPTPNSIASFTHRLQKYKHSKGAIQFQHSEELPLELIREITKARMNEILNKS